MTARIPLIGEERAVIDRPYSCTPAIYSQPPSPSAAKLLLSHHMLTVLLVLADAFDDLGVGIQVEGESHRPGFGVRFRIIECDLDVEVSEVGAVKAFGDAKGVGVGVSGIIEPALIIESDGLGNERVAFPSANRISEPGLGRFGRKSATVGEDLPIVIELLIEEHNDVRCLDDLERKIPH